MEDRLSNITPREAVQLQKDLALHVKITHLTKDIHYIAGADVSLNLYSTHIYTGIIVLSFPDLLPVAHALFEGDTHFPYIPGLLSFREIPALLECWKKLTLLPDIVMVDGQGIAHPRRIGIASHFGVLADVPTIGCAKSLLCGSFEEPESQAGHFSTIIHKGEEIGMALRSKNNVKPLIVSPGHLLDMSQALDITKNCVRKHRLPEPTRLAHELVNKFRKGEICA